MTWHSVGSLLDDEPYCDPCLYSTLIITYGVAHMDVLIDLSDHHGHPIGDIDPCVPDDQDDPPIDCHGCGARLWSPWLAPFTQAQSEAAANWQAAAPQVRAFQCCDCERVHGTPARAFACCETGEINPVIRCGTQWDRARFDKANTRHVP